MGKRETPVEPFEVPVPDTPLNLKRKKMFLGKMLMGMGRGVMMCCLVMMLILGLAVM